MSRKSVAGWALPKAGDQCVHATDGRLGIIKQVYYGIAPGIGPTVDFTWGNAPGVRLSVELRKVSRVRDRVWRIDADQ